MSKEQKNRKESKKQPLMSPKEKRAAKHAKNARAFKILCQANF